MLNLSEEDDFKYRLYNLCIYIRLLNIIHCSLFIYTFIISLEENNLKLIFLNCLHLFLVAPLMYYCVKYYILYFIIFSEMYKICFIIFKLFEFYHNYNVVDIILVQIDMYIIYFNIKYIHYNYNSTKDTISELCNGWKPNENILYLY